MSTELNHEQSRSNILNEQSMIQENYNERFDRNPLLPVEEPLKAFKSGVGSGNDLKIAKQTDGDYYENFNLFLSFIGTFFLLFHIRLDNFDT